MVNFLSILCIIATVAIVALIYWTNKREKASSRLIEIQAGMLKQFTESNDRLANFLVDMYLNKLNTSSAIDNAIRLLSLPEVNNALTCETPEVLVKTTKRYCQACTNEKYQVKTRVAVPHTCGKGLPGSIEEFNNGIKDKNHI